MRLLQLATGPDELLDLHPNLTVVVGLDGTTHATLVEAVSGLVRAAAPTEGLLEAHGVLFDLDDALLRVLEIQADDLDPVVRPGDLPTGPISVDARELRALEQRFGALLERISAQAERQSTARGALATAEQAVSAALRARREAEDGAAGQLEEVDRLTRRLDELNGERRRLGEELEAVRASEADAAAARAAVEEQTAGVREARDVAAARRRALEQELADLGSSLDPSAAAALDEARAALREADARRDDESRRAVEPRHRETPAAAPEPDDESEEVRAARLEARAAELAHLLAVLEPIDGDAVAQALAVLEGDDVTDLVPSAEGAALADELDALAAELGPSPAEDDSSTTGMTLAEARSRLDDARQALLEAEQAVRNPELDRDDVDRLEDLHAALLDASDRADRRLTGERARRRVDELRAAEQEVLDRLGFASYSEYMMGSSLLHADPAKEAALDRARAELAAVEDDWHRIQTATDTALARAALLDRRRLLLDRARELLGHAVAGGPPQDELRALRVPAVSRTDAARRVQEALVAAGVELGDEELEDEELALLAEAWLDEAEQVDRRRREALHERATIEEELEGLGARHPAAVRPALHLVAEPANEGDPEQERRAFDDAVVHAQRGVVDAEARHAAHVAVAERQAVLETELATARDLERAAAEAAAAADQAVAAAHDQEASVVQRRRDIEEASSRLADEAFEVDAALGRLGTAAPDIDELNRLVDIATSRREEAIRGVQDEDHALAALDAEGRAAAIEIERLQDIVAAQGSGEASPADELEWYLLARLAAQRSASVAGSLPLLLDDALRGLDPAGINHVLDRLEPMAEAVQVIIVSDDPVVAAWAAEAGPARAAVVRPAAA